MWSIQLIPQLSLQFRNTNDVEKPEWLVGYSFLYLLYTCRISNLDTSQWYCFSSYVSCYSWTDGKRTDCPPLAGGWLVGEGISNPPLGGWLDGNLIDIPPTSGACMGSCEDSVLNTPCWWAVREGEDKSQTVVWALCFMPGPAVPQPGQVDGGPSLSTKQVGQDHELLLGCGNFGIGNLSRGCSFPIVDCGAALCLAVPQQGQVEVWVSLPICKQVGQDRESLLWYESLLHWGSGIITTADQRHLQQDSWHSCSGNSKRVTMYYKDWIQPVPPCMTQQQDKDRSI